MDEIEKLKNAIREVAQLIAARGQPLSPELKETFLAAINHVANRINELRGSQPLPADVEKLWVLSGAQPETFESYAQSYPNAEIQGLANQPVRMANIEKRLEKQITLPAGEQAGGIPKAPLQSAAVYGFQYDPRTQSMFVKFNGKNIQASGPVYRYSGVPPAVFKIVQAGAVPAKTSGQNKWGQWWKLKKPSLGGAVSALIKNGGFPYQRVA